MPPRKLVLAFLTLWFTLGVVVLVASVQTFLAATRGGAHVHAHMALLAGIETIAAALFLVPKTMRFGAIGLLATFAVAFTAHAVAGEFATILLLYAAATVFVLVHGTVPLKWVRSA